MSVAFGAMPSRTPTQRRRTAMRHDPYWSSVWRTGSVGDWVSYADAARLVEHGVAKLPAWLRETPERAWERIEAPRNRETVLRLMAVVDMWRTLTAEQWETFTGARVVGGGRPWVGTLWAAGLIDVSIIGGALLPAERTELVTLVRPARESASTRRFQNGLTWAEWVSVTGGHGLDNDRQYTRHNVLTSELALRYAEYGKGGIVLGEKLAGHDLLAYSGLPVPSNVTGGADAVFVRRDGLRIAVEMTASRVGPWFAKKMDRIATLLHQRPMSETGLVVLLVSAPHQDATVAEAHDGVRALKKHIANSARLAPGQYGSYTRDRLFVTSWTDLFPAPGQVAEDFGSLPAERMTLDGEWERVNIHDTPFAPNDESAMRSVLSSAAGLRGLPVFQVPRLPRPDLSAMSMSEAGLARVLTEPMTVSARKASVPERLVY